MTNLIDRDKAIASLGKEHNAKEILRDLPTVLNDKDLLEIEHRFGAWCRFVVEDMISGKGERWKVESAT